MNIYVGNMLKIKISNIFAEYGTVTSKNYQIEQPKRFWFRKMICLWQIE